MPADELDPDATEPGPLTDPPALEFELPEPVLLDAEAEELVLVEAPLPLAVEEEFALALADCPLLFVACELPDADALAVPVPDVLADVLDEAETDTPPLPVEAPAFDLPLALGPLLPA